MGPKITPASALEMQDEAARFWASKNGVRFMQGWVEERERTGYPNLFADAGTRREAELRGLLGARTYFVSEEMVALAEHAAATMPRQEMIESDLPCPSGFMVLEKPIVTPDARGKQVTIAAYRWWRAPVIYGPRPSDGGAAVDVPLGDGVMWVYYSDTLDPRDAYMEDIQRIGAPRFPSRLVLLGEDCEVFGKGEVDAEYVAEKFHAKIEDVRQAVMMMRRLPMALWTLMQQRLAVVTDEKAHRVTRRQLARAGSPLAENDVRVVRLRRLTNATPESGEAVEWSHRWIVSGHWRQQWLPSVKAHRLQWIAPFVKGPDDKPLRVKRTVHSLVR